MHIATKRLLIREFEFKDWQAVYEYTSDINVMKYIPEGVFSKEDAKEFVNKNRGDNAEKFPVVLRDENFLIGHIVFYKYFGEHTYEIGWVFNPKYQNRGYASEAARAILEYGFKEMNLHRIISNLINSKPFFEKKYVNMKSLCDFKMLYIPSYQIHSSL